MSQAKHERTPAVLEERTPEFEQLLDFLKNSRGFDFTGYKMASLSRRIRKRMQVVRVDTYPQYIEFLERAPDELTQLFNTVLINVTAFFRDGAPWEYLAKELLPQLLARKPDGSPIRAWSAGCATGEEAYTLAIIFAEALGLDEFRERVKIYATDVDDDALTKARQASYEAKQVVGIPPDILERYFEVHDGKYVFRKDLRRAVIFGRNDLIQDAPISRIDILVSRNTLMYFNAQTQTKILARFHFALNEGGYLILGRSETLLTHNTSFTPVDLKRRIFTKTGGRSSLRDKTITMPDPIRKDTLADNSPARRLREAAFDARSDAQIVIDRPGHIFLANDAARELFSLGAADLNRPLQDFELSYRPTELRSPIDQAYAERRTIVIQNVKWVTPGGDPRWFNVSVVPLFHSDGIVIGASIVFSEVTAVKKLQEELEHSHQELEAAYEELQSTNEELETTNEELQSTIEELETTNEELQSTNEELETMNEELQSTNEELQTINDELRRRSDELNHVNSFLEAVFASLRGGVAVLDPSMQVVVWNHRAEDLWGVRSNEAVGTHFLNLDIGLPVDQLKPVIRAVTSGEQEATDLRLPATNRRGKPIICRVSVTQLVTAASGDETDVQGVILLMEEELST